MKKEPPLRETEADYSEKEIARRRDEVTRRMLNTPYSPQAPTKKARRKKKKAPANV